MFCPKCGANMRDGQYCPVCGYFASGQAPSGNYYGSANNKAAVSPKNSRNKILPLLAILIAVVLAAAILVRNMTNNGTHAIKKFFHAMERQNAREMMSCVPDDFIDDLIDDYDVKKSDIKDALEKYLKTDWVSDYVETDYEPGEKVPLKILDHEKMDKEELSDIQRDLTDVWTLSCKQFDSKKIKKAETYNIDFDNDNSYFYIVSAFQYKGNWYYYNALALMEHATRLYG